MPKSQFYTLLANTQLILMVLVSGPVATGLFMVLALASSCAGVYHVFKESALEKSGASGLTKEKV